MSEYDVIVVGGGNAAMCAAISAAENGAKVALLERAPEAEAGGNSRFTAGGMRFVYDGEADIRTLVPDLTPEELANTEFGTYNQDQFYDDMFRVTEYRCDPDLTELLVTRSFDTLAWMRSNGVRFAPMFRRQSFKVGGKVRFWGGLTLEAWGGGEGLVEALTGICRERGIDILYGARARELICDDDGVHGVVLRQNRKTRDLRARAVILAAGGFQANSEWRTRYLGPGWELAKVRGSRFNTGDGIQMALDAGAMPWGNWSGCHSVGWDRNAPPFGDLAVGDGFQKHSYPFGIMVNARGERFVDEGLDFRNYTYVKFGRAVLEQPSQFAWQVFDAKVDELLRDEYRIRECTRVEADSLEALAKKLDGVDPDRFLKMVAAYNDAVDTDTPFDPTVKDGRGTRGLPVDKTNWANRIDTPPFKAFQVTCGITFTFGGVRIGTDAQVRDTEDDPLPGLYACGEMVGGLFWFNYPGGTGLTNGSVFGRIAGANAAAYARG